MAKIDAVELARLAGRLSLLVPPLAAGWVRQKQALTPAWGDVVDRADIATGRLIAVVEAEVDRLYLAAFAAAGARVAVSNSWPRRDAPEVVGYPVAALAVADELTGEAGWLGRRSRYMRRLAADLRQSVALCRRMIATERGAAPDPITSAWQMLADRWEQIAEGTLVPYRLAAEPVGRSVFHDGDRVVVNTGIGDDRVSVESDPADGQWRVVVNGHVLRFPSNTDITVRTGPGDDQVIVSAAAGVTVLGGSGNDDLRGGDGDDWLSGGPGDDYLDGGGGGDVLSGGPDDDVLYGGDGGDLLLGGPGADYLDGGEGPDLLDGGSGRDILSGGDGDDALHGGDGDDLLYPGRGLDRIDGGDGHDAAYLTSGDHYTRVGQRVTVDPTELDSAIRIVGDAGFVERVRADLRLLATSPIGQRMLTALRLTRPPGHAAGPSPTGDRPARADRLDQRDALVIIEDTASSASMTTLELADGRRLSVFTVTYDPARGLTADHSPPIIGLFHELAHVYDFTHGTGATGRHHDPRDPDRITGPDGTPVDVPNDERAAVGLPIDHDGDPSTPHQIDPKHPYELTENALRDEMGIPRRQRYGR